MISPALALSPNLNRRSLLRGIFLGLGAAAIPAWVPRNSFAAAGGAELDLPSGPLANIGPVVKQTLTSGAIPGVDDLVFAPEGFSVRAVARAGLSPLTGSVNPTGFQWHINPDGGAVFPSQSDGGWVYVSNSETTPGGVGALRFSADGTVINAYRILDNTRNNCAGGPTPWGTWLSCEETTGGFVYECNPFGVAADAVQKPALGAFPHEAAAIDPIHHVCYLTEDGGAQRFRRFVSDAADLTTLADGSVRMGLASGRLQRLKIDGFADNSKPTEAEARVALKVSWVEDSGTLGTVFSGGEGVYYYEVPAGLRTTPALGSVPTRGVIFFACKGDNRVYALDIENQLIELIFDNANMQITTGFDDVDNVTVSPAGDVLVAEDGEAMRLYVIVPNKPAKLLMQITKGGSEITGPSFTPDGSRLYFSSQRGPSGVNGLQSNGVTFEMTIPAAFRTRNDLPQLPTAFSFVERTGVATSSFVTSESVKLTGFAGVLAFSVSGAAQFSVNGGSWQSATVDLPAGSSVSVRHRSADQPDTATVTTVRLGSYETRFQSTTTQKDRVPDAFSFTSVSNVEPGAWAESAPQLLSGFDAAVAIQPASGQEYAVDGGQWLASAGLLNPGQTLRVRHRANTKPLGYSKTSIRVGGVSGSFISRSRG